MPPSARPITLTFSHFLGPDSFFERDVAQPWTRELAAMTGGRAKVTIHNAASRFGDVTQQATQVANGTIDIALGLCGAEGGRFPRSSIIELPFLVRDAQTGSRSLWQLHKDGVLGGEYQDFRLLALFVHNPGLIHTAAKRIVAPADLNGVRLRAPNATVAAALASLGAVPVILQVNDVMPAVREGRIDGIVTNWGNPLPGFNDAMTCHTDIAFYTSAFFVVMNRRTFAGLPVDIRAAIDTLADEALADRLGRLWNTWDRKLREGAEAAGHTIIVPDAETMAQWRAALHPATQRCLHAFAAGGFADVHRAYDKLQRINLTPLTTS
jgi:TRAP-type C4-dicarboxylate transport system substrate-binding protein